MDLGERLYELRKAKGLSQEGVADILGVTRQTVSKWETNQTTPDFDKIVPLCKLYEITTDELLTGEKSVLQEAENQFSKNEEQPERYSYYDNTYSDTRVESTESENADIPIELIIRQKRNFAMMLSTAIFLYILSPVPFFFAGNLSSPIMMALFFVIIAAATMLIVFAAVSRVRLKGKNQNKKLTKDEKLFKQITNVLSLVTLAIYLFVSFITKAWNITWILWIMYVLICQIIKLVFSLKGVEINEEK